LLFGFSDWIFSDPKKELTTISSLQAKIKSFRYREIAVLEKIG
jgi:hypothetical protein